MPFRRLLILASVLLGISSAASATELPVSGDAYVSSSRTTTNFGAQSNLYVDGTDTTYIQFDLSGLPSTLTAAQIAGAKVTFFVNRITTAGTISISAVTSTWAENSVTYGTKPNVSTTVSATATPSAAGTYITVDLTALVQSWIAGTQTNYGIALTSTGAFVLDSKENDQTAHAASLNVTTTSGTTLSSGSAAGQLYLTGASGAVPTTPVSVSGDITLAASGVAAIAPTAGANIVAAVNAGASVIVPAKLGTGSGTATTFLNGTGAFVAPISLTTIGSGAASLSGNTLNIPTPSSGGVGSVTYTNNTTTGSAQLSGTNLAIAFPVAIASVNPTNTGTTGTASISGTQLNINFPVVPAPGAVNVYREFYNGQTGPIYQYAPNGVVTPTMTTGTTNTSGAMYEDSTTLTGDDLVFTPRACTLSPILLAGYSYFAGSAAALTISVFKNAGISGASVPPNTTAGTLVESCTTAEPSGLNGKVPACTNTLASGTAALNLAAGDNFYIVQTETNAQSSPYLHYVLSVSCQ